MARPSITAVHSKAMANLSRINTFLQKGQSIPPSMRGFVAEILMLRLFSILEESVRETACRVACGVAYRNGTVATPIRRCANLTDAINQFKTYNRRQVLQNLRFTNFSQTRKSVINIIPNGEPFLAKLGLHSVDFDEMRKVRNHIAHRYRNTYLDYKQIIIHRYGAYIKQTPGVFLISTTRSPRSKIEEYYIKIKVIINDITNG